MHGHLARSEHQGMDGGALADLFGGVMDAAIACHTSINQATSSNIKQAISTRWRQRFEAAIIKTSYMCSSTGS